MQNSFESRISRPFQSLVSTPLRALQGVNSFPSRFLARERVHVRPFIMIYRFSRPRNPPMQPARFVLHLTEAGSQVEFEYARAEIVRLVATSVTRGTV